MKNIKNIVESKYPPVNNEDLWLKDGKLYHSTSLGWVPLSEEPSITETYEDHKSSISYSGKDGLEHKIELNEDMESDVTGIINDTFVTDDDDNITFTDSDDTEHTLVTTDTLPSILANNNMLEVTWLQLKDLRDNSQLTAGCLYRIIDYNCTTTQENTCSAVHQFDIVLLALSENKLAEEGWAMMHDNIYDVTFSDGVTKKCYLYENGNIYLVNIDTLLGTEDDISAIVIDESNKTATYNGPSSMLSDEDVPYNYFQNSNLSAWKVWYCLDNDKSRFAWACDGIDENVTVAYITSTGDSSNKKYERYPSGDTTLKSVRYYAWKNNSEIIYTKSDPPVTIADWYSDPELDCNWYSIPPGAPQAFAQSEVKTYKPVHKGTNLPGHGVIYRLVDEWNNDCPYDFKNIQFKRYRISNFNQDFIGGYLPDLDISSLNANIIDSYCGIKARHLDYDESEVEAFPIFCLLDYNDFCWFYTFTYTTNSGKDVDATVYFLDLINKNNPYSYRYRVNDNIIESNFSSLNPNEGDDPVISNTASVLNNIVLYVDYRSNTYPSITKNYFDKNSMNITVYSRRYDIAYNTIDEGCYGITFNSDSVMYNKIGRHCMDLLIWGNINIIGDRCVDSMFSGNNVVGSKNQVLAICGAYNNIGHHCVTICLNSNSNYNVIGSECMNISMKSNSSSNIIKDGARSIDFLKTYSEDNIVESNIRKVTFTTSNTTSVTNKLKNVTINILKSSGTTTINHPTTNDNNRTTYISTNDVTQSI